jgi:hypothetical protein
MKCAPRPVQPFRDNSDASPPFPKVAPATNGVAFGICGWPHRAQHDNQMLPQCGSKPESAKRLYTAKRMLYYCFACTHSRVFATITGATQFVTHLLLVFGQEKIKTGKGMNQKAAAIKSQMRANVGRVSKPACQIMRRNPQCLGNFYEGIHRGRFFSTFDATDENRRKPGLFSQLFLTELGSLSFGANGFTQKTAVLRVDRHGRLGDRKRAKSAMSLTTDLSCARFGVGVKDIKFRWQTN